MSLRIRKIRIDKQVSKKKEPIMPMPGHSYIINQYIQIKVTIHCKKIHIALRKILFREK
jgi:hypothetical protein